MFYIFVTLFERNFVVTLHASSIYCFRENIDAYNKSKVLLQISEDDALSLLYY